MNAFGNYCCLLHVHVFGNYYCLLHVHVFGNYCCLLLVHVHVFGNYWLGGFKDRDPKPIRARDSAAPGPGFSYARAPANIGCDDISSSILSILLEVSVASYQYCQKHVFYISYNKEYQLKSVKCIKLMMAVAHSQYCQTSQDDDNKDFRISLHFLD